MPATPTPDHETSTTRTPSTSRYIHPGRATALFNALVAQAGRRGISLLGSRELRVRGRRSGEWRSTPVNPLTLDGVTYLVAPRGNTQWVRNLRAAGGGELVRGRRTRRFAATELPDSAKPDVLRAYLRRWRFEWASSSTASARTPATPNCSGWRAATRCSGWPRPLPRRIEAVTRHAVRRPRYMLPPVVAESRVRSARRTQHERSAASAKLLVAATIELIAEKGFERTTAAEIGERAGYSREMVRHRYGSKEQLLEWLLEHEHKTLLLRPPSGTGTGLEQALEQVALSRQVVDDDPERLRAFFVLCFESVGPIPGLGPWMREWFTSYQRQLADLLRLGQADGSIRLEIDPDTEAKDITYYAAGLSFSFTLHRDASDFASAIDRLYGRLLETWQVTPG